MAQFPTPSSVQIAWAAIAFYYKKDKARGLEKITRAVGLLEEAQEDCEAVLASERPSRADMDAWKESVLQAAADLKLIAPAMEDCNEILEAHR